MITNNLYDKCGELFNAYPLAVNVRPAHQSMVLMTGDAKFHILLMGADGYSLLPWRAKGTFKIEAETWDVPAWVAEAITHGVPIPRDGSLFGWKAGEDITAMVAVYTQYDPDHPVPSFAVMPLAGSPENQWPPLTGERFFGPWFWEHYRAGRIVSLAGLIAGTRNTVFWVPTEGTISAGCNVVKADVSGKGGVLRQGAYVYFEDLRAGKPGVPLSELLADPGQTDLAPRFKRMAKVSR